MSLPSLKILVDSQNVQAERKAKTCKDPLPHAGGILTNHARLFGVQGLRRAEKFRISK